MTDNPEPHARAFAALPKPEGEPANDPGEAPRERGLFSFPDGALGILLLLVIASVSGGLIAAYWPWVAGTSSSGTSDRIASLETRVGQLAAGQAPSAAAGAYSDVRHDLTTFTARLDADEARLAAIEKSSGQLDDVDVSGLKTSLDQLSGRVANLEQPPPAPALGARPAAGDAQIIAGLRKDIDDRTKILTAEIAALNTRVGTVEHNAPPSDLVDRLNGFAQKSAQNALDARIAKLESENPAAALRRAAAALALANLVRVSEGSGAFAQELNSFRALAGDSAEASDLARHSRSGAPTRAVLAQKFPAMAAGAMAAERAAKAQGWLGHLLANLEGLVSIRRIGGASGNSTEGRLSRAETHLDAGDLAGAVAEVKALDAPARGAAGDWLAGATARLAVDRDARVLTDRLVRKLAPPSGAPG